MTRLLGAHPAPDNRRTGLRSLRFEGETEL